MNQSPEDETVKNGLIGKFDGFYPDTGHTSQTPEDWRERFRAKFIMDMSWINTDPTGVKLESFIQSLLTETTKNVEREKLIEMGQILLKLRNTNLQSISNVLDQYHDRISKALNPNSSDV